MDWQKVEILESKQVSFDIKKLVVKLSGKVAVKAGQHFELRMLGENVSRKYSITNEAGEIEILEFGVQLKQGGAVSPKLWELKVGDYLEIRGPHGTSFIWENTTENSNSKIILLGAGSGITPLLSIYKTFTKNNDTKNIRFIVSSKTPEYIYDHENTKNFVTLKFTKTEGRISKDFLHTHISQDFIDENMFVYICGPDEFIDDMVDLLLEIGVPEDNIRSERFI